MQDNKWIFDNLGWKWSVFINLSSGWKMTVFVQILFFFREVTFAHLLFQAVILNTAVNSDILSCIDHHITWKSRMLTSGRGQKKIDVISVTLVNCKPSSQIYSDNLFKSSTLTWNQIQQLIVTCVVFNKR